MTSSSEKQVALIVDDDTVSRLVLARILETHGLTPIEARKGAEASRVLDSASPSLVIVDGLLPDTDGIRWIEKERWRLPPCVIFASAFWKDHKSYVHLTKRLAVSAVLPKPFLVPEVSAKVAALLHPIPMKAAVGERA